MPNENATDSAQLPAFMTQFLTAMSEMQKSMVDMAKGQNEKYETLLEKFTESVTSRGGRRDTNFCDVNSRVEVEATMEHYVMQ
ncbi:hypothetical protein PRIPAC_96332 [Pristionchus pacificus]|uniref:Uncharacterized protein n=1 Tax=Pristionchus pacificus TaxID=54126 RepID=A0A2A6B2R4_PRIPA|nr:hypothetical protein PRIPAC_96332 [Pristionchus pacificus]|eukprot:PDM60164.1 hypothetical protein PRIPAC_53989 [Pristionchus pacificus]